MIKLRHTQERTPTSMLLESPWETNTTLYDPRTYFRFRQMKCVSPAFTPNLHSPWG